MHSLGQCEFRCFVYPGQLSCVAYSIDIFCLSLTLNKLFRKPFLVRSLCFTCTDTVFFTLFCKSSFIGKQLFKYHFTKWQVKQKCHCFFKVIVTESPPSPKNVFIILNEVHASTRSDFQIRTNRVNNDITTNASKSDILTLLISPSADISEGSIINQSSSTQSLLATFSPMALLDPLATAMLLRHVKMFVICKSQCVCLFDIQKMVGFFLSTTFSVTEVSPSKRFS